MDAVVVGIDVSKLQLDVHIRPLAEHLVFPRTEDGVASFVERLRPLQPRAIGLEATGGFEALVVAGLAAARLPVVVVNPAQVRAFARALIATARKLLTILNTILRNRTPWTEKTA